MKKRETDIIDTKFKAKTQTIMETYISEDFYGYHIKIKAEFINVMPNNKTEKIVFDDIVNNA